MQTVTIVVVSRHRPKDLQICLTALKQLYYAPIEIVVVADQSAANSINLEPGIIVVPFDERNISRARNIGINAASGEIIAFIDDDAVPEPTWLDHLIAPFTETDVAAAGGYVIGRNGFSLQWGALSVDEGGWTHPIEMTGEDAELLLVDGGTRAIRTQGTNMAVRRDVLQALGGFDPAYAFYHDECDLNVRIAKAGYLTAIVPKARVHHKSSGSEQRRPDRAPRTLFDVGASSAVFHRKYLKPSEWARAREELLTAERRRLDRMLIDGRLEPRSFEVLMRSLHDGYNEGLARDSGHFPTIAEIEREFIPIKKVTGEHQVIVSRFLERRKNREAAKSLANTGIVTSLIILDPTARFHRQHFTKDGYWELSGGIFGKADRSDAFFSWASFKSRAAAEVQRLSNFRSPISAK